MWTRTRTHKRTRSLAVDTLKGIYILAIQLSQNAEIRVGALGELSLAMGTYLYVGSAQNGLEKRVERHFRKNKRRFWHIDYLLENAGAQIVTVFFKEAPKTMECTIAEAIGKRGEGVASFGCSDCHCKSHLFRVEAYAFLNEFLHEYKVPNLSASS
jgi:Uri superfamily endonuclease